MSSVRAFLSSTLLTRLKGIEPLREQTRPQVVADEHATDGRLDALAVDAALRAARCARGDRPGSPQRVDAHAHLVGRSEYTPASKAMRLLGRSSSPGGTLTHRLAGAPAGELALARHVVEPEHDVLRRVDDRLAARGREDVVRAHHEHARLHLRLDRQRHVHGHLVAVEVGVERRADERVELDGLALDEHRLEGLDAEAVERRRAVQHHRVLGDDLLEDVPDLRALLLDELLGALDGVDVAALFELVVDERLEELERHLLRQTALVQAQRRTDDDDRAARVVDALAEQVLAEAALLALEHVRQRLQRALVRARDRLAAAAVVEEGVDRLLQHAALVADDDLRRVELDEALEAVVAVDDAAVEVVEVAGREAAAVERDERAEVRRQHRDDREHHPLGAVAALAEGLDDLEALGVLLPLRLAR
jgi:hypothetical protein